MNWPQWIETLKERYLAGESSVFVLHGAVRTGRWDYAGDPVDCPELLRLFLERSRDVVGILRWEKADWEATPRLDFPGIEDRGRFTRHVNARLILDGVAQRPDSRKAPELLGLMWLSMDTAGMDHAFLLDQAQRLHHARKKRGIDPVLGAPPLAQWNQHPAFRESNNVVVLMVESLDELHPSLVAAGSVIQVPEHQVQPPAPAPVVTGPSTQDAMAEVEAALSSAADTPVDAPSHATASQEVEDALSLRRGPLDDDPVEPAPPEQEHSHEPPAAPELAPTRTLVPETYAPDALPPLSEELETALRLAILRHPQGPWPLRIPGREALAQVLGTRAPNFFGALQFTEVEGQVRCSGPGAERFEEWYRGDIAVDAAVGMALGALETPEGGFHADNLPSFEPPAMRALTRRVEKLLDSL
ncbi:MAG: hypothetical protein VX899_20110 [Myxococcota bacterium]|nr:hypothetical protein [Myxococcota bacterium]